MEEDRNDEARGVSEATAGVAHEGSADSGDSAAQSDGLEGRLKRLEAIVQTLDSDGLELDQALALFEEGVGHVREAQKMLEAAELRVEELIGPQGEERRDFPVDADREDG